MFPLSGPEQAFVGFKLQFNWKSTGSTLADSDLDLVSKLQSKSEWMQFATWMDTISLVIQLYPSTPFCFRICSGSDCDDPHKILNLSIATTCIILASILHKPHAIYTKSKFVLWCFVWEYLPHRLGHKHKQNFSRNLFSTASASRQKHLQLLKTLDFYIDNSFLFKILASNKIWSIDKLSDDMFNCGNIADSWRFLASYLQEPANARPVMKT